MRSNPNLAVAIGALLALPFTALFVTFRLGVAPSFGSLDPLLNPEASHLGSFIVFGAFLLLLVGFGISLAPIVRALQPGSSTVIQPINLLVAAGILCIVLAVVGAIIKDQYPCWIGVPNCD